MFGRRPPVLRMTDCGVADFSVDDQYDSTRVHQCLSGHPEHPLALKESGWQEAPGKPHPDWRKLLDKSKPPTGLKDASK